MYEIFRQLPKPAKVMFVSLWLVAGLMFGLLGFVVHRHGELHSAIRVGDVQRVVDILDRAPERTDMTMSQMRLTPLLEATWHDQPEVVDLLLRRGANIRATWDSPRSGDGGWTALHIAGNFGSRRAADVLIRAGADVNPLTFRGQTPLDLAVEAGQSGVTDLLRANGGVRGTTLSAASR